MARKTPREKTVEERAFIAAALRNNENLRSVVALDDDRVNALIDLMWQDTVPEGKRLIQQGCFDAHYFYVVQHGSFVVTAENGWWRGVPMTLQRLGAGSSFGELALLYLVPRAATVQAVVESVVWVIDRANFKKVLMKASEERINQYMHHLNSVDLLSKLTTDDKRSIAGALIEKHFNEREVIIRQGDPGSSFFILIEGKIAIRKDNREMSTLEADISGKTFYFGERALLENEPRAATVEVVSSYAKALALDRESFDMLLGPLRDIGKGQSPRPKAHETPSCSLQNIPFEKLSKIGLLGCGGFGTVELMEHVDTGETYALKGVSKGFVVKVGAQQNLMNEKNLMSMVDSPFIIKLYSCYNRPQTLFFLMEVALGGELFTLYSDHKFHGKVAHAKFYAASVLCAFEHLHKRHIIYRDLKPENLLVNGNGWLKLTDFGLAKYSLLRTYTTCGTPEYFAPEVISSTGHTAAVDWWAYGVIIYEWLAGHSPFEATTPMKIYQKIMRGIDRVNFPSACKGDAEDLIRALLKHSPSERLPCLLNGTDNVRKHNWFKDFDWQHFADRTMDPPFVPVVETKNDLANFRVDENSMPMQIHYKDDGSGWDAGFEA